MILSYFIFLEKTVFFILSYLKSNSAHLLFFSTFENYNSKISEMVRDIEKYLMALMSTNRLQYSINLFLFSKFKSCVSFRFFSNVQFFEFREKSAQLSAKLAHTSTTFLFPIFENCNSNGHYIKIVTQMQNLCLCIRVMPPS